MHDNNPFHMNAFTVYHENSKSEIFRNMTYDSPVPNIYCLTECRLDTVEYQESCQDADTSQCFRCLNMSAHTKKTTEIYCCVWLLGIQCVEAISVQVDSRLP